MSKNEEEFNQLELLDELCNDEIEQYIIITSRGDGKSFKQSVLSTSTKIITKN